MFNAKLNIITAQPEDKVKGEWLFDLKCHPMNWSYIYQEIESIHGLPFASGDYFRDIKQEDNRLLNVQRGSTQVACVYDGSDGYPKATWVRIFDQDYEDGPDLQCRFCYAEPPEVVNAVQKWYDKDNKEIPKDTEQFRKRRYDNLKITCKEKANGNFLLLVGVGEDYQCTSPYKLINDGVGMEYGGWPEPPYCHELTPEPEPEPIWVAPLEPEPDPTQYDDVTVGPDGVTGATKKPAPTRSPREIIDQMTAAPNATQEEKKNLDTFKKVSKKEIENQEAEKSEIGGKETERKDKKKAKQDLLIIGSVCAGLVLLSGIIMIIVWKCCCGSDENITLEERMAKQETKRARKASKKATKQAKAKKKLNAALAAEAEANKIMEDGDGDERSTTSAGSSNPSHPMEVNLAFTKKKKRNKYKAKLAKADIDAVTPLAETKSGVKGLGGGRSVGAGKSRGALGGAKSRGALGSAKSRGTLKGGKSRGTLTG